MARVTLALVCLLALGSPAFAGPIVTSTSPVLTAGSNTQVLTIAGTGFAHQATVTLTNPAGLTVTNDVQYLSPTQLTAAAVFTASGSWRLRVKVKQSQSNIFYFTVTASAPPPPPPPPSLTITSCPAPAPSVSPDGSPILVSFLAVSTAGGVAPIVVTYTPNSGTLFPVGQTAVNVAARDAVGQTASCSFTVTVTAAAPPPPPACVDPCVLNPRVVAFTASPDPATVDSYVLTVRDVTANAIVLTKSLGKPTPDTVTGCGAPAPCIQVSIAEFAALPVNVLLRGVVAATQGSVQADSAWSNTFMRQ